MTEPKPTGWALTRQRAWLLEHFPADRVMLTYIVPPFLNLVGREERDTVLRVDLDERLRSLRNEGMRRLETHGACRCWSCGKLLGERALFVSKVDPAGTTRRSNIRPACHEHATLTTATVQAEPDLAAGLRASFERRRG